MPNALTCKPTPSLFCAPPIAFTVIHTVAVDMATEANLIKEKGNAAFKDGDYSSAYDCFTDAMRLDPSDYAYPLNRAMANLKLKGWDEAESDATTALALDPKNLKAYYRRSLARREQGNFSGARQDIEAYAAFGGDPAVVTEQNSHIMVAELSSPLIGPSNAINEIPQDAGYILSETAGRGMGVFASRVFRRGDLILAERPIYVVDDPYSNIQAKHANIMAAFNRLSAADAKRFMSLSNAQPQSARCPNAVIGIHSTNAFAGAEDQSVLCVRASRVNHSCLPNARYSWHAAGGCLRIYALRDIAVGEEICHSYISSRGVYGSSKEKRQQRLRMYGFLCACPGCTLPDAEQDLSDRRREEIASIWESVPYYGPSRTENRLHAIVRAVRLLKEEGYAADADDFTNDAAGICACHSDWTSVEYWAKKTYETRVAEFGKDSQRAAEVRSLHLDLRHHPMAASQRKQIFNIRL